MREKWTDERLDDLNHKVDGLRIEMNSRFDSVDLKLGQMQQAIFQTQRTIIQVGGGIVGTLVPLSSWSSLLSSEGRTTADVRELEQGEGERHRDGRRQRVGREEEQVEPEG